MSAIAFVNSELSLVFARGPVNVIVGAGGDAKGRRLKSASRGAEETAR